MQAYHFAAALDGEIYVSGLDAEDYECALDGAFKMARNHFDIDCRLDEVESRLGGFTLWAAASFEYC